MGDTPKPPLVIKKKLFQETVNFYSTQEEEMNNQNPVEVIEESKQTVNFQISQLIQIIKNAIMYMGKEDSNEL